MAESVPTVAAAQRAAGELVAAGVGRVLLHGSLARGEQDDRSDIDLVAIYDDLDYTQRWARRCDLERRAEAAAGCPVDVHVTDSTEWAVRTTKVPASFEAHIAGYARCLAGHAHVVEVDWGKEIGLPETPAEELQRRFEDMSAAVLRLRAHLRPTEAELEAFDDADRQIAEDIRHAAACAEAHMVIECAAKAVHVRLTDTAPPKTHSLTTLLAPLPDVVREEFGHRSPRSVELGLLHLWRQGGAYAADWPDVVLNADTASDHVTAALDIAAYTAEQCRDVGLDPETLRRFGRHRDICRAALHGTPSTADST